MEGPQTAFGFDARTAKVIHGFKDAACQLVSCGGAGDNGFPNPVEVGDIFAVDGRERAGVICQSIELLGPRVYSVYDGVIYLVEKRID